MLLLSVEVIYEMLQHEVGGIRSTENNIEVV